MQWTTRGAFAVLFGIGLLFSSQSYGQVKKDDPKKEVPAGGATAAKPGTTEHVTIKTPDGLSLSGTWYPGGKGKQSDCVMLLHNYQDEKGSESPGWDDLAKALQTKGYAVLSFDFRGHKYSAEPRTIATKKDFAGYNYNALSGAFSKIPPDLNSLRTIHCKQFKPGYYPYLINDIAGARVLLDKRNDAGECNVGHLWVIADRKIGPLAMYWAAIEFDRNGSYPKIPGTLAPDARPNGYGGNDLMGMVFLSYEHPREASALSPQSDTMKQLLNFTNAVQDEEVLPGLRDKVGMLFVGNGTEATQAASPWLKALNIRLDKGVQFEFQEDPKAVAKTYPILVKRDIPKGKYVAEVKGDKLRGIDLVSQPALGVDKLLIDFAKRTRDKGANGNDWKLRNADNAEPLTVVPVNDRYFLPLPK